MLAQPLLLTLRLRGETVAAVEPPGTGFCRRDIEALVENKGIDEALTIIERSCSFSSTAHRTALCRALEADSAVTISQPARMMRILFAEIERILARLWVLARVAQGLGMVTLWRTALQQREELFAAVEQATGRRQYWGIATPGGVRDGLELDVLHAALERADAAVIIWRVATGPRGRLGRSGAGVGPLTVERATALGLEGLAGGGSAARDDLRRSDEDYEALAVEWPSLDAKRSGDVAGRLSCAVEDLATSIAIAQRCLQDLPVESGTQSTQSTQSRAALTPPQSEHVISAAVEGSHGAVRLSATLTPAGTLRTLQLQTPGAATLAALPEICEGRLLAQVPAILASLDLCLECLDH